MNTFVVFREIIDAHNFVDEKINKYVAVDDEEKRLLCKLKKDICLRLADKNIITVKVVI